eukprot:354047-Chlamydomonas_euryale.AAC.1
MGSSCTHGHTATQGHARPGPLRTLQATGPAEHNKVRLPATNSHNSPFSCHVASATCNCNAATWDGQATTR